MPFPVTERVIYQKHTLDTVICQLRFPTILKIGVEPPAAFQHKIRNDYPMYSENTEFLQELKIPNQIEPDCFDAPIIQRNNTITNYQFCDFDDTWKVNLTNSFIALSTRNYVDWQDFSGRLEKVISAFTEEFDPLFYTRIGLRYVNVIDRDKLGLVCEWRDLIQSQYLGFLASDFSESLTSFQSSYDIPLLDSKSNVKIVTTLARKEQANTAKVFVIDSDFYCMLKTNKEHYKEQLDFLNSRSSRLIRSIITSKLHYAMEPRRP